MIAILTNKEGIHISDKVTGTLIWYYYTCRRQVWLMAHELNPDEDHQLLEIGRLIHETSYARERKELSIGHLKIDTMTTENGKTVIGEIKKSSRFEKPAVMQLAFYLSELKEMGVELDGLLMIPKEKKRIEVVLTPELEQELQVTKEEIRKIIAQTLPPAPVKTKFCKPCAYEEFCWA